MQKEYSGPNPQLPSLQFRLVVNEGMDGVPCHVAISRNGYVPCHINNNPMSLLHLSYMCVYKNGGQVIPLTGGPQCHMSNLRNSHVPCHHLLNVHVDSKIGQCRMSILRNSICHVVIISLLTIGPMSHVDFKKCPCHRV